MKRARAAEAPSHVSTSSLQAPRHPLCVLPGVSYELTSTILSSLNSSHYLGLCPPDPPLTSAASAGHAAPPEDTTHPELPHQQGSPSTPAWWHLSLLSYLTSVRLGPTHIASDCIAYRTLNSTRLQVATSSQSTLSSLWIQL